MASADPLRQALAGAVEQQGIGVAAGFRAGQSATSATSIRRLFKPLKGAFDAGLLQHCPACFVQGPRTWAHAPPAAG